MPAADHQRFAEMAYPALERAVRTLVHRSALAHRLACEGRVRRERWQEIEGELWAARAELSRR